MLRIDGCPECDRLWRDYARSTTSHIRLESKLEIAALEHDPEKVAALTGETKQAAAKRAADRQAITGHESEAHGSGK